MAVWSKLPPGVEKLNCRVLAHPWTDSCLAAAVHTWADSCIGSFGFFFLLYLCQYASTVLKKKKKADLMDYLGRLVRSTAFGANVSAGTFAGHCLLRRILGKYYYYTSVFLPALFAGLAAFFENRRGQELATNAFANCALELWLRLLEYSSILRWSPNTQTITFMVVSAGLSSLLSCTNFNSNYFWFFIPPKADYNPKSETRVCFHKESCRKHISSLFLMYSTTGLMLQFLRLFMKNLKNPELFISSLTSPKAFKLAAFLGGYVVIYQAIRCFLYQKEKKYSLIHDSLAGFLAGVAFRFQPTIPILNSAIITTLQILAEVACQRKILPSFPYLQFTFALLCAVHFHSRVFLSEHCPQLMNYITSTVTHGMADRVSATYKDILTENADRTEISLSEDGNDSMKKLHLHTGSLGERPTRLTRARRWKIRITYGESCSDNLEDLSQGGQF